MAAGGLVDIILDEETGYLVENDDNMIQFSMRVVELAGDVEKRLQFGANGLAWAQVSSESFESLSKTLLLRRDGVGKLRLQF